MFKTIDTVLAANLQANDVFKTEDSIVTVTDVVDEAEFFIEGVDQFEDYIQVFASPFDSIDLIMEVDDEDGE